MEKDIEYILNLKSSSLGYTRWGISPLKKPITFDFYKKWIQAKHFGDMDYLEKHTPMKEKPEIYFKPLKSVLSFSFPYSSIPTNTSIPFKQLRISLYAQGYDYHLYIKSQLEKLCLEFKETFPNRWLVINFDREYLRLLKKEKVCTAQKVRRPLSPKHTVLAKTFPSTMVSWKRPAM